MVEGQLSKLSVNRTNAGKKTLSCTVTGYCTELRSTKPVKALKLRE